MSEHTIQIEGLPEGFEVVGVSIHPSERNDDPDWLPATVKLRKTKQRLIVLEETNEDNIQDGNGHYTSQEFSNHLFLYAAPKIWRIKEE